MAIKKKGKKICLVSEQPLLLPPTPSAMHPQYLSDFYGVRVTGRDHSAQSEAVHTERGGRPGSHRLRSGEGKPCITLM